MKLFQLASIGWIYAMNLNKLSNSVYGYSNIFTVH